MTSQVPEGKKGRGTGKDILQVAKRAGVSPATVSRVANGRLTVDKRLAKKLLKAIEELGYLHQTLKPALWFRGGAACSDFLSQRSPIRFFPRLIQSFEAIAGENDFEVMVGSTNYNVERAKIFAFGGSLNAESRESRS